MTTYTHEVIGLTDQGWLHFSNHRTEHAAENAAARANAKLKRGRVVGVAIFFRGRDFKVRPL